MKLMIAILLLPMAAQAETILRCAKVEGRKSEAFEIRATADGYESRSEFCVHPGECIFDPPEKISRGIVGSDATIEAPAMTFRNERMSVVHLHGEYRLTFASGSYSYPDSSCTLNPGNDFVARGEIGNVPCGTYVNYAMIDADEKAAGNCPLGETLRISDFERENFCPINNQRTVVRAIYRCKYPR